MYKIDLNFEHVLFLHSIMQGENLYLTFRNTFGNYPFLPL